MPTASSATKPERRAPRGRGRVARALAGLWLLFYVGLVGASPVADAFVDHGSDVVVHVEDAEGGHCPASHGDQLCEICQFATGLRALQSEADVSLSAAGRASALAPGARGTAAVELHFLDGRSSRAPPLG